MTKIACELKAESMFTNELIFYLEQVVVSYYIL